jgi:CheY-like chemotaxis protein
MSQAIHAGRPSHSGFCLIVDSLEEDQHRLARLVASGCNMVPKVVETLAAASDYVTRYRFDLVIIDNSLPDGRGITLAQRLRRHPAYRNTPMVVFDDWTSPFMREKASAARVNLMVRKQDLHPVHLKELVRHGKVTSRRRTQTGANPAETASRSQRSDVTLLSQTASQTLRN